ncbi:MAG: trypsin-like peptidase domain-containing protein [Gemmatimonadaceae bacterium]
MFTKAIEIASQFTRPIHMVLRNYGSSTPWAGAGTLFVVNSDGWALTCRHIAAILVDAEKVNAKYRAFSAEADAIKGNKKERLLRKALENKYGYTSKTVAEIRVAFVDCVDPMLGFTVFPHPDATTDAALIRFDGFKSLGVTTFPTLAKNGSDLKQGKHLCRLGFPFPEFNNFAYDSKLDCTSWTAVGRTRTPRFPMDGMVTRHLASAAGQVVGFEMSTPGLRGQSGGPAFDFDGCVWGMQFATNHLDLDFDVDTDVLRSGTRKKVHDSAFLHVGQCVHVDVLTAFMSAHGVTFHAA